MIVRGLRSMIELKNINKTFKVARRNSGFSEAAKSFFRRDYELIQALKDITFTIKEGEMVGYIGPNGAGKSSTIKIMSGILTQDSGECIVNGRIPWKERISHVSEIGVVFGQRSQLWWDVPVIDSFELIKDIYKIPPKTYRVNLDELISLLNIGEVIKTPARQLSLGQRTRCEIAASLLHNPKILFLDEPTIGLDAVSKIAVREFIKTTNQRHNTTVILTTHDMQDIEALTERIILIGKGQILLDGALTELKKRYSDKKTITVEYTGNKFTLDEGMTCLEQLKGHAKFVLDTNILSVSKAISEISRQVEVLDISISGATAEEMVVSLYEEYKI